MNIPVDDPKLSALQVDVPNEQTLSISFESFFFRVGWQGLVELRFNTEKAQQFHDVLISLGAQKGAPADAADHCR